MEYLTQDQVDKLPEGTKVTIIWSGGNGPHDYIIAQTNSGTFVYEHSLNRVNFEAGIIGFVGKDKINTRVWKQQ